MACSFILTCFCFFSTFQSLPFTSVAHAITKVDSQPMLDGGVLVHVLGQVKVGIP